MSWIKIRTNLATDPAVAAIGISTKMHPRQVVGCLVAVWCWADPLTADGFIPHATEKLIDDISGKRGFAAAMVGVQWLCVESGGIRFPNWDRHHSQSAKARAGESERKRISRHDAQKSASTVGKMSGQTSGQVTEQSPDQIREEEIREENTTLSTPESLCPESASPPPDGESGKKAKPDKHPNPEAEKFVDWFLALLAQTGAPVPRLTPSSRYGWADAYDKMIRLDGRTKEQVKAVCNWARNDDFWRRNFLSPVKLRTTDDGVMKFDLFVNKMGGFRGTASAKPSAPAIPEPAGWREFVTENMPDCPYAPNGAKHGCAWADVEPLHQRAITDGMKQQ